jgi:transketolase
VDGAPRTVMNMEPIVEKIQSFGWNVYDVDGHNPDAMEAAAARRVQGLPTCLVCRTSPWRGISSLQNRYPTRLHYVRLKPGEDQPVLDDHDIPAGATP